MTSLFYWRNEGLNSASDSLSRSGFPGEKLVEIDDSAFFLSSLPGGKSSLMALTSRPGPEIEPSPPSDPFISASRGDPELSLPSIA
ncbi:hypothetical protein SLA2020_490530 [Shorea laevis]